MGRVGRVGAGVGHETKVELSTSSELIGPEYVPLRYCTVRNIGISN